jgi:Mrp family chromosome partitioning ATPase/capsular polysaccharide biosynthesis protein
MTFEQYWTILIKRWKLIVICFLFVGAGSFVGSKLMKPLYQSSALVQIVIRSGSSNQADYNNLLASDQLVQTEAALTTSDPVLREVASHYPGMTVSQLAGEVSTATKANTQLFEIDVVDLSPTRAASLANDVAATLIKQQLQSIQQDNAQAQQQIQQNLDQTSQQINETTTKISDLQAKGGNQAQVALLQTQLAALQQKYSQWQSALVQLELTQTQSGNNPLRLAQPAQPAGSPVRPNTPLYTAGGLLVGLLLGMLLALLYERLDTRVRTPEELTQLLGWPVLATIWRAGSSKPVDVINPAGNNVNVEPYRILRTNIGFSSLDKPLRSLVVTSALPHDGKSVNAANLAIFMAKAGKNTLLIDADLRSPIQHVLFNLSPNELGLSNAVLVFSMPNVPRTPSYHQFTMNASTLQTQGGPPTSNLSLEPFVHSVGIPNLWVMPSGPLPPNPSEFLESKAMQRFLGVIANCGIEVVIFDTPPLLGLSDASILASKVDGALVVVDTTRATKEKLKQMKAALSQTGVHVLGCVANKLRHKRNDSAYYYYQHAEAQESSEKSARNGHMPSVPTTPGIAEPSSEQQYRSN